MTTTIDRRAQEDTDKLISDSINIVPEMIEEEYTRLPGDIGYWNAQFARAVRTHLMAKRLVKKTEARLTLKYSRPPELLGDALPGPWKQPSVAQLEALVQNDDELEQAEQCLIEAEVEKTRIYGIVEAVRAKREMIVSLGAHLRIEMQHDPIIRDQATAHRYTRNNPNK